MTTKVTKQAFLALYRAKLPTMSEWARDPVRLDRFMASVEQALNGGNTWMREGKTFQAVLIELGLPKRISLKALHALPEE